MIHPVILAGGAGTRLWPVSRKSYPKQFAQLIEGQSLFQRTIGRVSGKGFAKPIVITAEDYRFIARQQLADVDASVSELVIEPVGRNTAAAILTAALIRKSEPEAILAVLPSDHMIEDEGAFRRSLQKAMRLAAKGAIVTFGIQPDHAATGFGYLKVEGGNQDALMISEFSEKPEANRAAEMLVSGSWLWNSGMFLFRVDAVLKAFEAHAPEMLAPVEAALALGGRDLGFRRLSEDAFFRCQDISFDHAIMEHVGECAALELTCGWSDLGSWTALKDHEDADDGDNVTSGNATAIDCEGTLLKSENPDVKLVGLGLKDIVAVATDDGILVADASHGSHVGKVVETLRAEGAQQADGFRRCYRPWGYYETLSLGPRFQVKRIMVEPGAKLSLQSHLHRAEHWVVVSGSAMVTVDDDEKLLSENESTYIPLGAVHRLENPGKLPLHLIEVQSGCYLGEDDIIRYEDIYDRAEVA
ncbi:mannose-1-phosphate guanylyltransferase/mannose-6-phosphate isomerase [Tateyamaria omphalii]|uniref:mannose-1-phosphate guanylyltransferase/mannose-6-phosphate isomerase n=1 Tax=Tateyamaria omphalii TaxID=299262 RepID=UPI001676E1D9|nr:mannose-1-phosphate guanylyltransferase/mannose-6-phosphate isomerase [Tateyamaria omphalii]GGX59680.1 mannose-1-phosphate guanylyltransferase/mannose-6-phosphate isomerase [Tateyamaria omphalii]